MNRASMDRFIDTIEWIAAGFVGIVALNIFISVVLRNTMNYAIPDSFDIGRILLGILIFWGIAAPSYRGGHITVDLIWANVSPKYQRWIEVFETLVLLFVVTGQTGPLLDKGRGTYSDNVLPFARVRRLRAGGMGMVLVGVPGFGYLVGFSPALKLVGQTSMRTVTDYTFGVILMFLLMGTLVRNSGMSRELFRAANGFVGHLRGGLGIATVAACGGFAAICGSSVATAATFSAVAYPEMRRFGYPQSFATGVIAAGGTLGAMLPPSTVLAVYAIITEQDIGKLFIAGIIPGLLAMTMYMITIALIGYFRPGFLPKGTTTTWPERFAGLKDIWAPVLLFVFVIGGLYGLPYLPRFTPTEAGGVGATGAFLIGVATGRLDKDKILASLLQATRTAAAVFTVLIGALIFGYFLTVTQTPQKVTEFLTGLGLGSYGVLAVIMVMYLVLGCRMDAMAMIILTVPIIFPVISHLGFDPIWFGVIIVMTVELGLIHPPVGMNVFVIKSVVKDVSFATIFKGVIPFVLTDLVRLVILIAFPLLATWLPQRMMAH